MASSTVATFSANPNHAMRFSSAIPPPSPRGLSSQATVVKTWGFSEALSDFCKRRHPPSDTYAENRDANEEVKTETLNIKAQTVAATLTQPCLARNTLLYHLIYKYTAFFKPIDPMI